MEQITVRIPEDHVEEIESRTADRQNESKSDVIRNIIDKGLRFDDRIADLREQIDDLETENDRLQRQLMETNRRVGEHQDLVRYVEQERQLTQEKMSANAIQRAKWWLFGRED